MKMNKQSGQVLVGAAVAFVVLAGFTGLAIDMGTLRYQRRVQQTAADSGAVAGAQNLSFNSGWIAGAQVASSQNGFTDGGTGAISDCDGTAAIGTTCVEVVYPPADRTFGGATISGGPHAGSNKYIEVLVAKVHPTYFMTIFGVDRKPVVTRAVATNIVGGTNANCLYTLGFPTSAIIGVNVTGNAILNAPKCGIADNGNFDPTGNSYTVHTQTFSVSGTCTGNTAGCGSVDRNVTCAAYANEDCPPLGGVPATEDPMTGTVPPSNPGPSASCPATGACDVVTSGTMTLQPGQYSSILVGKNSVVTMQPGIYYINGSNGLGFNGGGTLTSAGFGTTSPDGVMIYFTGSATLNKVNGGGNLPDINLNPLTTAQSSSLTGSTMYQGLLFYQDPNDTATPWFGGDNNSTFNGTVYFPSVTLTFYGNTTVNFNGATIANSVAITGSPIVNFGVSPSGAPVPQSLARPVLVE